MDTDTLIIGAGPAGLACGACLKREGIPFVVLEQAEDVGNSWRNHYRRLHLHTVKRFSHLPWLPYPSDYPCYPSRQQVVDYLESYAEHHELRPHIRFGERVERATPTGGGWCVAAAGQEYRAARLIVATSYNAQPHMPDWPGRESFGGDLVHSADYRDGQAYRGKRALVVGFGNTGAEIALDLHEHGAETWIAVRSPVHVIYRDSLLVPAQVFGILMRRIPTRLADAITRVLGWLIFGRLKRFGLTRSSEGQVSMVKRGRIPLIDIGTLALMKSGALRVVPGIERFAGETVTFTDGQELPFDLVVLATGFKARLDRFLTDTDQLVDERGYPRVHGRGVALNGVSNLYFIGFANPISGALREISIEARRVASDIARKRA